MKASDNPDMPMRTWKRVGKRTQGQVCTKDNLRGPDSHAPSLFSIILLNSFIDSGVSCRPPQIPSHSLLISPLLGSPSETVSSSSFCYWSVSWHHMHGHCQSSASYCQDIFNSFTGSSPLVKNNILRDTNTGKDVEKTKPPQSANGNAK